jgi:hypothetical protein
MVVAYLVDLLLSLAELVLVPIEERGFGGRPSKKALDPLNTQGKSEKLSFASWRKK